MENLVDLDLRWISFENLEFGIFKDFVCGNDFCVNKGGDIFYQLVRVCRGFVFGFKVLRAFENLEIFLINNFCK